jgi:hypothetical protein
MAPRTADAPADAEASWSAALARSPLLAGLPAAELAAVVAHAERVEAPAGAPVVREGDAAGDL